MVISVVGELVVDTPVVIIGVVVGWTVVVVATVVWTVVTDADVVVIVGVLVMVVCNVDSSDVESLVSGMLFVFEDDSTDTEVNSLPTSLVLVELIMSDTHNIDNDYKQPIYVV